MNRTPSDKESGGCSPMGCLLIVIAIFALAFMWDAMFPKQPTPPPRDRHGNSLEDDPYYDAPGEFDDVRGY